MEERKRINGAELLVRTLEEQGIEYIFGVPGDIENEFFAALKNSPIKFFNVRHEQSGAFMADVYYRLTDKTGVCFSTLGPGATNMLTGVANALQERSAVLALSGQLPLNRHDENSHQYIDLTELYRPVTKKAFCMKRTRDMKVDITEAIKLSKEETCGPVHISIPTDIMKADALGYREIAEKQEIRFNYKDQLEGLSNLLKESESVVAIIGRGVTRANANGGLKEFLESYNIPFYMTFNGKGVVPANHPLGCGCLSRHSHQAREVLGKQDLVITIGYDRIEGVEPDMWENAKIIANIDNSPPQAGYNPSIEVVGPIGDVLEDLVSSYAPSLRKKDYDLESMRIKVEPPEGASKMFPYHPASVMKELSLILSKDDIVVSDVGLHKQFVALYYDSYQPNSTIFSNGFSSMGFSLPAAIATKLVHPERNVIAITGDGGFQMNVQELATATENNLGIKVLVMNDNAYGMVKLRQLESTGECYGSEFKGRADYAKISEGFGARGYSIENGNLRGQLESFISSESVAVADVPIQQYSDIRIMK